MHESADRLDFAPPPQPAALRALVLAVIAHLLLLAALTWGISWNRESADSAAEAELWASVPLAAAPRGVVQAPALPATPPAPAPPPEPRVKAEPPPPPAVKAPDIALEREKVRREQAERRQEELERQKKVEARKQREEQDRQKKLADARKKQDEQERLKKLEAQRQQQAQQVAQQNAAEEAKRKKADELAKAKAKARQEDAKLAEIRNQNLARMKGLAGAAGSADASGATGRSGPSASYAGRIAAQIKRNIVFNEIGSGNPSAVVQIKVAPDGTIIGRNLIKSSGMKAWDEAVLRAIDRTEVLPRDTDGSVVPQFPITFKLND